MRLDKKSAEIARFLSVIDLTISKVNTSMSKKVAIHYTVLKSLNLKVLRQKGLNALEKLMGMLLLMMAVQMFIDGIRELFHL